MSTTPRHPVYWPRMKIRGRRRRALAALKQEVRTILPMARVELGSDGLVTATALSRWEPGARRVEFKRWVDGFGRPVGRGA